MLFVEDLGRVAVPDCDKHATKYCRRSRGGIMQFCASVLGFVPVKRFYKYLLKRCFGSFLAQEIDLSDLDVQLFRGIVCLQNLALDPNALNALHGFDLSVVDGKIGKLKMSIPWRNLLHERTKIYLENVHIVVRAAGRSGNKTAGSAQDLFCDEGAAGTATERGIEELGRVERAARI